MSRYLMIAHWAIFAAGVFVVAGSVLQLLQFSVLTQGLEADRAYHDTYYVFGSKSYLLSNLAVIAATALVCWGLRHMARRFGTGE